MTYTQQLRELLNELKLAKGKNCLISAISERPARLKELIESNGFDVREIYLEGKANLLEMLLTWKETTENTIYVVHGIANQFPWVLPYINLHRDLFFDIKRPVVVLGSEYEIKEIQKHAPDWFRFRSRTYELKEEELGEEGVIMSLAEPTESKPVYYPLPVFVEEGEEEIKERIKIDEYLLSAESDDYKLAELYMSLSLSYFKLSDFERGEEYLQKSLDIREKLKDNKSILLNYRRLSSIFIWKSEFEKVIDASNEALKIEPNLAWAYVNRGTAYAELKQYERAIKDYNKAIELNPNLAEAYENQGIAHSKIGRYEEAARDLKEAGILFLSSKRRDDSVRAFSFCFNLLPKIENDDLVYSGLALFLITLNPDVIIALKRMRIAEEPLRKIFELTLMKLQDENISEGIAMLEEKEKTEENKILLELLKRI
jgi:tetratricopeptide (TPR) repeat protein